MIIPAMHEKLQLPNTEEIARAPIIEEIKETEQPEGKGEAPKREKVMIDFEDIKPEKKSFWDQWMSFLKRQKKDEQAQSKSLLETIVAFWVFFCTK